MTKTWNIWFFVHKSRLVPFSIFVSGLLVFAGVAIYNLSSKHTKVEDNKSREEVTVVGEVEGEKTEVDQPTIVQEAEEEPTPTITSKAVNKIVTQTPVATTKPGEVKEIHTKETIEEKTVVVVTAVPASATPTPTDTPTPTGGPFKASFMQQNLIDGSINTVTANMPLQSCDFVDIGSTPGTTDLVRGSGEVNGNICTVRRLLSLSFGMRIVSTSGDELTFGDW